MLLLRINKELLKTKQMKQFNLPRPDRKLIAPKVQTIFTIRDALHNRRAGIEPLIGHIKHGGQMDRSRMKSDMTIKSSGYAAVLGFNLRQLTRNIVGEIRQAETPKWRLLINETDNELKVAS